MLNDWKIQLINNPADQGEVKCWLHASIRILPASRTIFISKENNSCLALACCSPSLSNTYKGGLKPQPRLLLLLYSIHFLRHWPLSIGLAFACLLAAPLRSFPISVLGLCALSYLCFLLVWPAGFWGLGSAGFYSSFIVRSFSLLLFLRDEMKTDKEWVKQRESKVLKAISFPFISNRRLLGGVWFSNSFFFLFTVLNLYLHVIYLMLYYPPGFTPFTY